MKTRNNNNAALRQAIRSGKVENIQQALNPKKDTIDIIFYHSGVLPDGITQNYYTDTCGNLLDQAMIARTNPLVIEIISTGVPIASTEEEVMLAL